MKEKKHGQLRYLRIGGIMILSAVATLMLLKWMLWNVGSANPSIGKVESVAIMERFHTYMENSMDLTVETEAAQETARTLSDSVVIAPRPRPECYGQAEDPGELQWLLEQASGLLDGEKTLFSPQTAVKEDSTVYYYLDETIFAITWKQVVDRGVYTFSEVKIGHPSQFRRFFADNQFDSQRRYTTTEMSKTVNAVVASSGDYYGYRSIGIVVNNGQVFRDRGQFLDTCYIDDQGDLLFTLAGEITDTEALEQYIAANHIRFSLSFGPLMIRNGITCVPRDYNSGEINSGYARAALCQLDHLHYLLVTANMENPYLSVPTVAQFAENLARMGIPTAYALDGGQTASIAMDHQLMNQVSYGSQRKISDIIYFATALPE